MFTGLVEETGTLLALDRSEIGARLTVRAPLASSDARLGDSIAINGSIAVDGISLTVAEVRDASFIVWIIPHTLAQTNLRERRAGRRVNLEFDLLAKYLDRRGRRHHRRTHA